MSKIYETCSCGASFEYDPYAPPAKQWLQEWRDNHKHDMDHHANERFLSAIQGTAPFVDVETK